MLRVLVPFVTPSRSVATTAMCEICGNAIGDVHRHIVEIGERGAHVRVPGLRDPVRARGLGPTVPHGPRARHRPTVRSG